MCGTTWYQAINQENLGDTWSILSEHYVTAKLNEANLESISQDTADQLLQAQTLLASCAINDIDRDFALALKDELETFNEEGCELDAVVDPADPDSPIVPVEPESDTALIHIRSIYDVDGKDKSALGIPFMAIPSLFTVDQRSERFVRVLTENMYGELELQGYTDIQPDGSVIFEVPANTPYTFEVVNKNAKALNENVMEGSEFAYDYLQRHPGTLQADKGEKQQCHGCHIEGSDYDHANESGDPANKGALSIAIPWPSANPFILSIELGNTMAEALYQSIENVGQLTPELKYQDNWALLPFRQNESIEINYEQLTTASPVSVACEQNMTPDCVANISYASHIQPIWDVAGRDEDGNSCVDCHDDRGFTKLSLSGIENADGKLASYENLFSAQRSFMFLSSEFSEVSDSHCRITVQPPFLMEPENDCFSCFEQALFSKDGAISSANFFDLFDEDTDGEHWLFNPAGHSDAVRDLHKDMLNGAETKLIAEWVDMGATF